MAAGIESDHRETILELLLEYRADLNYPARSEGINDVRALHIAAMWGYDLTIKLLLYHGADASLRDSKGMSPIDYASVYDNYLCISLLLRYGSLNSTAAAWSAIMDSSLGESNADSSFENCLYYTALDYDGDRTVRDDRRDFLENIDKNSHITSILSDLDEEDDYDPLDSITENDIDLNIDNHRLRTELRRLGRHAGPITDTTKRLYCKLLARLAKEDKDLVYSPRTTNRCQLNGYSVELNSILTGRFCIKQALELEREFIRVSGSKPYHGPKQSFNYILIDPRITQNLPEQALDASDSDTSRMTSPEGQIPRPKHVMRIVNRKFNPKLFTKFIEGIFYIGKGQKNRDLTHLYDALVDRESITHKKIERIRSIWADGYGVISLHLFHNITDKEALAREALMIETVGLKNLTNLLHGSMQLRLGWNEHQRKLLGALLMHRAYTQHLNEGERQIRRFDLRADQNKK